MSSANNESAGAVTIDLLVGPPTLTDVEDSAASFAAMEAEVAEGASSRSWADAILPCKQPCLEITLLLEAGTPAAFADYTVTAAGHDLHGKLDANGYVRLEGVDVPADQMMLEVEIEDPEEEDSDEPPKYRVNVVPIGPQEQRAVTRAAEDKIAERYFNPTFDRRRVTDDSGDFFGDEEDSGE